MCLFLRKLLLLLALVYLVFYLWLQDRLIIFLQLYHAIKEHKIGKHKFEGMAHMAIYGTE